MYSQVTIGTLSLQQSGQNSKTITTSAELIQNVWFRKGNFPKIVSILDQTTIYPGQSWKLKIQGPSVSLRQSFD